MGKGHEPVNVGGQEVKDQGHTRPKRFVGLVEALFSPHYPLSIFSSMVWYSRV